tara:strand:- start:896 stop:1087 length:192 start_codon:yes stop_codon:yes gene_type:complete
MSNILYIQEYRIKRDLKEVEDAIVVARRMISRGVAVPDETLSRLENMRMLLEQKLIDFVVKED